MICSILMSPSTRYILQKLEKFPLFETADEEDDSMKDAFDKHGEDRNWTIKTPRFYEMLLPKKLFIVIVITAVTIIEYYYTYCVKDEKFGWVSHSIYEPASAVLSMRTFIAPFFWPQS